MNTPIRSITIDVATNSDLRYEVFERLNRGSMALNEQELRNCVYRGPFNGLLAELERDPFWRKVKGGDDPEPRFKEREIILRVFACADRLQYYTGNLKRFLNEYLGQYAPNNTEALATYAASRPSCPSMGPPSRTQLRNTHRTSSLVTEQIGSTEGGQRGSLTSTTRNLQFPPRFASWIEEMEKRSDRHIRDLVAHTAFKV